MKKKNHATQFQLVNPNGKVLTKSFRKLDVIFKHLKCRRRDRVTFREIKVEV